MERKAGMAILKKLKAVRDEAQVSYQVYNYPLAQSCADDAHEVLKTSTLGVGGGRKKRAA
jgi:hypothetical protein